MDIGFAEAILWVVHVAGEIDDLTAGIPAEGMLGEGDDELRTPIGEEDGGDRVVQLGVVALADGLDCNSPLIGLVEVGDLRLKQVGILAEPGHPDLDGKALESLFRDAKVGAGRGSGNRAGGESALDEEEQPLERAAQAGRP